MIMDPAAYNVVYVDRRARQDRVRYKTDPLPTSTPAKSGGDDSTDYEPEEVLQCLKSLLAVFNSVTVSTSGPLAIAILSDIDKYDPTPTLVLLDIPCYQDGKHDSGYAAGPSDMLYGLPLLKFICIEVEHFRMSSLIVPIAFLSNCDGPTDSGITNGRVNKIEQLNVEREINCIDSGAWDVLRAPFSIERAKALYVHCYRAKKNIQKTRKRSWVGVDDKPAREAGNYAYLREKMVSELMTDICKPKKTMVTSFGSEVRIAATRIQTIKETVGKWDFSAHDFTDEELVHCAQVMLQHALSMPEVEEFRIQPDRLTDFLVASRASYNTQIPYHNFRHVVDVLQAVFYFLLQLGALPAYPAGDVVPPLASDRKTLSHLITPVDALTLLVVAVGHDVGHPGVNNAFLVTLKAPLAQVYNDRSVLESFHCAAFSQVLRKYWPKVLKMRKMMIDMILATDMGLHFDYMAKLEKMKKKFEHQNAGASWGDKQVAEYRVLLGALLIKCADISNVARSHDCSAKWATILIDEFARQASMETDLGIPSSLVAPPVTGSVLALAKSQVGFMSLFAIPLFQSLSEVLPEMNFSVKALSINKNAWSSKIESLGNAPTEQAPRPPTDSKGKEADSSGVQNGTKPEKRMVPAVLGTVLHESKMPSGNTSRRSSSNATFLAGTISPRSENDPTKVTVVVTHPKSPSPTNGHVLGPPGDKKPTYQHSSEHLNVTNSAEPLMPDRPRSSPPDLGDSSDHSCTKGCCGTTTIVATTGTIQRRPSRFFKKVKIWRTWRKEANEGSA